MHSATVVAAAVVAVAVAVAVDKFVAAQSKRLLVASRIV